MAISTKPHSNAASISTPRLSLPAWASQAAKRAFDVSVAACALLVLAPFFLVIGLAIRRASPGPVFYRGVRLGRGGQPFGILKFRSMYERPQSYAGPHITAQGDERITPLGQWLRDTKINELPQLWNVLVGQMSLVGPRPEDPAIAAAWPADVRDEILSLRPGITSPASVAYHDEERRLNPASLMDDYLDRIQPDKLRLDHLYVRHHSFITDLDAIFWTLVILIPRLRAKKIQEGWLFGGPLSRLLRSYINWFVIDFLLALFSVGLVGVVWRASHPLDVGLGRAVELAMLQAFLFGLMNTLLGLKTVSWSHAAAEDVFRLFISCALVILVQTGLHFVDLSLVNLPLGFDILASLVVLLSCVMARYRLRLLTGLASRWINLRRSGYGAGERVLIVGAGEGGSFAAWLLQRSDFQRMYSIVGIVDDDPAKQGMRFEGLKVLGTTADIPMLVKSRDIGVIFYAIARISSTDSERILGICQQTQVNIVIISNLLKVLHDQLAKGSDYCRETCALIMQSHARPERVPAG